MIRSAILPCTVAILAVLPAARQASRDATPAARECRFEITSNKPFVQVRVNGSAPQWFILDSGCAGGSVIARECADRLGLRRGAEAGNHLGAGSGIRVGVSSTRGAVLDLAGDTLGAPEFRVFTLAHIAPFEGRRLDGLLGEDFLRRHVVEIDYARRRIRILDPRSFVPGPGGTTVPIELDYGLPVAEGSIALPGRPAIRCRLIIDTGVRSTLILFRPFAEAHGLLGVRGNLLKATVGGGAGGESRGDVGRLDRLRIGSLAFPRPTAIFSRDTTGVFASPEPDAIVGGELLRRCRVTFDYPHQRMILEPHSEPQPAFEYDMSGLFLIAEGEAFDRIVVLSVTAGTPGAEAGLRKGDRILAIEGHRTPALTLEEARAALRSAGRHRLAIERDGRQIQVTLAMRRLV